MDQLHQTEQSELALKISGAQLGITIDSGVGDFMEEQPLEMMLFCIDGLGILFGLVV